MAQEKNNRLFLSVSDADLYKLDILREELGMNRSQYIPFRCSPNTGNAKGKRT